MNGHPPTIWTATAKARTIQPLVAFSGASRATKSAASANGQETMARHRQPSRSIGSSATDSSSGAGSAEYPPAATAWQRSSVECRAGSKVT